MTTRHNARHRSVWLFMALYVFITIACLESPPQIPCDEKVGEPNTYANMIRENPVILQLNEELTLRQVNVASCFVNHRVGIGLTYELPASFSSYKIAYIDNLSILYSKDETIELTNTINPPKTFDKTEIVNYFKQRIDQVENNPRVRDVILKTMPDPNQTATRLNDQPEIIRQDNRIQYNFYSGLVRGYLLSNSIDWQEFPEIVRAHQVIEQNLLMGDLVQCRIGRSGMHAYTNAEFHDFPDGPWYLTVALQCEDGWKDAYVQINKDMSYERLSIKMEYKNK